MVKKDTSPHIVVLTPPSVFDAAVILRTLYAGLGVKDWRLTIVGLGRRPPLRLLTESRTPIEVIKARVSTELEELEKPIYVVDPRGVEAWHYKPPSTLVIDYGGSFSSMLRDARRVSSLGLNSLTYEAIGVIYEYWIRSLAATSPGIEPYSRDIRSGVYLARKAIEAITSFDNYTVLEPSVIMYTLRRIYLGRRVLIDPASTRIRISHVDGEVREELEASMYSVRNYKLIGVLKVVYTRGVLEVVDNEGTAYRIIVDPYRRRACNAPGLCVTSERNTEGNTLGDLVYNS